MNETQAFAFWRAYWPQQQALSELRGDFMQVWDAVQLVSPYLEPEDRQRLGRLFVQTTDGLRAAETQADSSLEAAAALASAAVVADEQEEQMANMLLCLMGLGATDGP